MKTPVITFLLIWMLSLTVQSQTSKTITVGTAGTLSTFFTTAELNTVTNLTLSGNIDARDMAFIHSRQTQSHFGD